MKAALFCLPLYFRLMFAYPTYSVAKVYIWTKCSMYYVWYLISQVIFHKIGLQSYAYKETKNTAYFKRKASNIAQLIHTNICFLSLTLLYQIWMNMSLDHIWFMLDRPDVGIVIPSNMLFCFEEKKVLTDRCIFWGFIRFWEKRKGVIKLSLEE